MNSTALGAENIIFISEAHEKFFHEKLKEVRYQDAYHRALVYCLGISEDTRRNVYNIYDFKTGCVKTECLNEGWQTSGSVKVVRMAFNLYCNGMTLPRFKGMPIGYSDLLQSRHWSTHRAFMKRNSALIRERTVSICPMIWQIQRKM